MKLPVSVCRQWLEDSLKENDPTAVQLFLVGTKKDLSVRLNSVRLFLESDVRRSHEQQQQPQTSGMLSSVSVLQRSSDAGKNVK